VPIGGVGGGRADAYQHLIVLDDRLVDLPEFRDIG
jgi:hypothetical protein